MDTSNYSKVESESLCQGVLFYLCGNVVFGFLIECYLSSISFTSDSVV